MLIPVDNVKDLVEMPDNIKNELEIVPVKWIEEVLANTLERQPEALPEGGATAPVQTPVVAGEGANAITH